MLIKNQNQRLKLYYQIIDDINKDNILEINNNLVENIFIFFNNRDIGTFNKNDEFNILCYLIEHCIIKNTVEQHNNILNILFDKNNIENIINGLDNNKKGIFLQSLLTNVFIRDYICSADKTFRNDFEKNIIKIIKKIYEPIMLEHLLFNINYIEYDNEFYITLNFSYMADFHLIPNDKKSNKEGYPCEYRKYANEFILYMELKHPYYNLTINNDTNIININVRKLKMLNENINVNEILTNYITSLTLINTKYNDLIKSYTLQIERKNIEEERIIERNLELEHDRQYEERLNFNVKVYEGENGNRYYHCTKCKHYYDNESDSRYCQCMR